MEKFFIILVGFLAGVAIVIGVVNLVRMKDCANKGGVYASPHCFKKEALIDDKR